MNRDPVEERGGVNLCGFVYNNSLMNDDSLGLSGVFIENIPKTPLTQAPSGNQLIPSKILPVTTKAGNWAKIVTEPLALGSKGYDVLNAYLSSEALSIGNKAIKLNEIKQDCAGSLVMRGGTFGGSIDGVKAWHIKENHLDIIWSGVSWAIPGIPDKLQGNVKMIYYVDCCNKTIFYHLVPYLIFNRKYLYFVDQSIFRTYNNAGDVITQCCK